MENPATPLGIILGESLKRNLLWN